MTRLYVYICICVDCWLHFQTLNTSQPREQLAGLPGPCSLQGSSSMTSTQTRRSPVRRLLFGDVFTLAGEREDGRDDVIALCPAPRHAPCCCFLKKCPLNVNIHTARERMWLKEQKKRSTPPTRTMWTVMERILIFIWYLRSRREQLF